MPQKNWLIAATRIFLGLMHRENLAPSLCFSARAGTPRLPDEYKRERYF